jgi:DNA-binding transcriptional LysR family regulator
LRIAPFRETPLCRPMTAIGLPESTALLRGRAGAPMELHQVRYMIALAEEGTFTSAAARCGITQPSLTNAIKKLEHELGRPLFTRKPTVALTPFGRQLMPGMYEIERAVQAVAAVTLLGDPSSRALMTTGAPEPLSRLT